MCYYSKLWRGVYGLWMLRSYQFVIRRSLSSYDIYVTCIVTSKETKDDVFSKKLYDSSIVKYLSFSRDFEATVAFCKICYCASGY